MKALTWQGNQKVEVIDVPDPQILESTDAIVKVTSTAICGSDLHLYGVLGPYLKPGDVLGHEAMGIVEEVGSDITNLKVGDRVVVPFNISCGRCWMCDRGLFAQCETTQNRQTGKGASLFGYTSLYGAVPGGQAEYLRVPQAHFGPIPVPADLPEERFLYLSDVLPTAWQAVEWADVPSDGTVAVLGLGPIGAMCARIALHRGARVIAVDPVPDRRADAQQRGAEVVDSGSVDDVVGALLEMTGGRGPDSVIDAVGMESAHSPLGKAAHEVVGHLPDAIARPAIENLAVDRMDALHTAVRAVRRGGTVSVSGVYGGAVDPMPLFEMFDRGITMRMG
ncbi:MAG: alcohol dehydrogenase catalytic domain-containing protein, partial [Actinobacteria bacterium]|nr:alcohol dehydrogenase catalytic domain-containing protein [Actinomycetota bacterium]